MGGITEIATGASGYSSVLPNTISPLARTLKLNGYSTAQFGKCHEVPVWESSAPPLAIILPSLRRTRFCGRWLGFAGDRKVPAVANSNKPEPEAEDRARKSPKEGPRVRRLTAGGSRIRTLGPPTGYSIFLGGKRALSLYPLTTRSEIVHQAKSG